jgi:hypothetical protein
VISSMRRKGEVLRTEQGPISCQQTQHGNRGHTATEVTRQPRSHGNRGHTATEVTRQPRSHGNRGHTATEVTRQPKSSGQRTQQRSHGSDALSEYDCVQCMLPDERGEKCGCGVAASRGKERQSSSSAACSPSSERRSASPLSEISSSSVASGCGGRFRTSSAKCCTR